MHKPFLTATGAIAVILTTPLQAATLKVSYADLDLSSEDGVEKLDRRIAKAAGEVCGLNDMRTGTRISRTRDRDCAAIAEAQARKQLAAVIEQQRKGG